MRTTIRLDDELMRRLKEQAARERVSLTRLLNQTVRAGLQASRKPPPSKRRYREQTYALGAPAANLDKALALVARLEDDEIARKMLLRK